MKPARSAVIGLAACRVFGMCIEETGAPVVVNGGYGAPGFQPMREIWVSSACPPDLGAVWFELLRMMRFGARPLIPNQTSRV